MHSISCSVALKLKDEKAYAIFLNSFCFLFLYFQVHPGKNVGIGKDHTIFSLIDGLVKFEKFGPDRKKVKSYFWNPIVTPIFSSLLIIGYLDCVKKGK